MWCQYKKANSTSKLKGDPYFIVTQISWVKQRYSRINRKIAKSFFYIISLFWQENQATNICLENVNFSKSQYYFWNTYNLNTKLFYPLTHLRNTIVSYIIKKMYRMARARVYRVLVIRLRLGQIKVYADSVLTYKRCRKITISTCDSRITYCYLFPTDSAGCIIPASTAPTSFAMNCLSFAFQ